MKRFQLPVFVCIFAILFFAFSPVFAQHEHEEAEHNEEHKEAGHSGEGHHEFHKHHVAILFDETSNFDHHTYSPTVGIDYEFRINKHFGIGLGGEVLFGDAKEIVAGIPVFYHFPFDLKILGAPILAFPYGKEEESIVAEEEEEGLMYGFRLGLGYDIHIKRFTISPTVAYDYIGGTSAMVSGVSFGVGF